MADITLECWVPLSQAAPLRYLRMRAVEKNSAKRAKRFPLPPAATPPIGVRRGLRDLELALSVPPSPGGVAVRVGGGGAAADGGGASSPAAAVAMRPGTRPPPRDKFG